MYTNAGGLHSTVGALSHTAGSTDDKCRVWQGLTTPVSRMDGLDPMKGKADGRLGEGSALAKCRVET